MRHHTDTNSEPTKEVRQWNGIPLNITTRAGESRFSFSPPMTCDYGCIRGSWGAGLDGKALDVYVIGDAPTVFRVVQITPTGAIDEYKYVLGAQNFDEAVKAFLKHVPRQLFGAASQYSIGQLQDDIAQQSKVRKDVNELANFVEQLEELIESDDAYSSNIYVLSFEVADNGDIAGRFEDAWNGRIFSYSVQKNRIGYKPALTLDRGDSATIAKRFDIFSSGYTSLQVRQDAVKSGKKPRCTAISYGCGRACIQLQNTCWINSSGQKVKKAGGAVASISQGRIDKLRTLARYLAANGNNKWSKYGGAELLAAKASNLERDRNKLIANGVKTKAPTPDELLKSEIQKAFKSGNFDSVQLIARESAKRMQSGDEVVKYLKEMGGLLETERDRLQEKHDNFLKEVKAVFVQVRKSTTLEYLKTGVRSLDPNPGEKEAEEFRKKNWDVSIDNALELHDKFIEKVAREFLYTDPSVQPNVIQSPIGIIKLKTLEKAKSFNAQQLAKLKKGVDEFQRMVGVDTINGKELRIGMIDPKLKSGSQRAFATKDGIYLTDKNPIEVIIHEAAHFLEASDPEIHRKTQEFFEKRTVGEKWQKLTTLTGFAYGSTEVAKPDKWVNVYMGKKASEGKTEILSMGMEKMYNNPIKFAQQDSEYFAFVWNTLRGK